MKGYKRLHVFISERIYNRLHSYDLFGEIDEVVGELLEGYLKDLEEKEEGEDGKK